MADSESTPPQGKGKDDHFRIEARRVAAELQVILDSVSAGLEAIAKMPEAMLLKGQMETVKGLIQRAIETVEGFAETVDL
jgi:hypothetical protein